MSGAPVTPEVSVIIPVYNVAPYLAECLDSVLGQSFTDLEVICVDDGSSDLCPDILADYARKDSRLKVVAQEHGGPSRARNKGLTLARGRYISFVDADDFLDQKAIEKTLTYFTEDVDYVCFRAKVFTEPGLLARERNKSYSAPPFLGLVDVDEAVIRKTNVHLWNKLYRRDVIERHRITFPDGLFYQDFTFTKAYLMVSRRAFYMDERLYAYRLRSYSTMARTRLTSFERASDHISVVMKLFEFLRDRGLLSGRESLLAEYFMEYFHLTWQYAPAEHRESLYKMAGQSLLELEAGCQDKNSLFEALLRDGTEKKHKLNQIVASPWHRLGRKLGLVKLLRDM